jgi:hypothetical protein
MSVAEMVWFSSPHLGMAALAAAVAAVGIAIIRRIDIPALSGLLLAAGILLLALAAGEPAWNRSKAGTIAVMADLSPSTRGARYRQAEFLRQRVRELIGNSPYQLIAFAEQNLLIDPSGPLAEMPADETRFSPVAADAIVLFSDARFDQPKASPRVYIAVDEGLENVSDASVQRLELRGRTLSATIANSGPQRQASLQGITGPTTVAIDRGTLVIARPTADGSPTASVQLNSGDLWPENDSLVLRISAPAGSEKWWIGQNPPGGDWRYFPPTSLSNLAMDYLTPAIIVVVNEPADHFTPSQVDCLTQYVRDLGGSLLIVGGSHAFAAGGYQGTALERLSPLASSPPNPATRWVLLVDGSGSMARDTGGGVSLWQSAAQAVVHLLPYLPPADPIQIGQFSDTVRWWLQAASAAEAARAPLPPADASPHGPTNLESALNQIADESNDVLPTELLLLSDCDTTFEHPNELADLLGRKKIRLHVLALGRGSALEIIRSISSATGGDVVEQFDSRLWAQSVANLSRAAQPPRLMRDPVTVVFENEAKSLPSDNVPVWNRVWLKPQAQLWANVTRDAIDMPLAGYWRVGSGCTAAVAWEPSESRIQTLASLIAEKPRDPRFSVQWQTGARLHVIVDAADAGRFLNDLPISLEFADDPGLGKIQLEQTAPGRYEAMVDAPRNPRIATLRAGDEIIDRVSLAGRYPKEFDAMGNDHAAMRKLAATSGGEMIWPTDRGPIDFRWPTRKVALTPWICALALVLLAAGLIGWRRA